MDLLRCSEKVKKYPAKWWRNMVIYPGTIRKTPYSKWHTIRDAAPPSDSGHQDDIFPFFSDRASQPKPLLLGEGAGSKFPYKEKYILPSMVIHRK